MTEEMTGKLKPCPFCDGNADVTMLMMGAVIRVHVVCQKCGATGKMRRTAEDAVLNWNMRTETSGEVLKADEETLEENT